MDVPCYNMESPQLEVRIPGFVLDSATADSAFLCDSGFVSHHPWPSIPYLIKEGGGLSNLTNASALFPFSVLLPKLVTILF